MPFENSPEKKGKRFNLSAADFEVIFVSQDIAKREEAMKKMGIEYNMGEIEIVVDEQEVMKVSTAKDDFESIIKD